MGKARHKPRSWETPDYAPEWPERMCGIWEWFTDRDFLEYYMGASSFDDVFGPAGRPEGEWAVDDPQFQERFPTLFMLMAKTTNDQGKKRETATLTIVCEAGVVKCGVKERNHGMSLWTASDTLGGAFASLEEALGERPVKWRKVEWKGGRK